MKDSTQEAFDFRVIAAVADTLFPSLEADAVDAEELNSGNAFHKGQEIATFMRTGAASPTVVKEVGLEQQRAANGRPFLCNCGDGLSANLPARLPVAPITCLWSTLLHWEITCLLTA